MKTILRKICPLCSAESENSKQHPMSREPWNVVQCRNCHFVFLQNPPEYEELEDNYSWEKLYNADFKRRHPRGKKRLSSRIARDFLRYCIEPIVPRMTVPKLLDRFAPSGAVLDVGCDDGSKMKGLDPHFIPWGIEISSESARIAGEYFTQLGGGVVQASALSGLKSQPAEKYTAVVMRSYLEHEISPREALIEGFRVLKMGGVIIIKTPNFGSINACVTGVKWCGIRLPAHVNYFRPGDLKKMVIDAGYSVLHFNPFRYRLPTSDNMWLIGKKFN